MQFNEVLMVVLFPVMMNVHPKKTMGKKREPIEVIQPPASSTAPCFSIPSKVTFPLTE